MTREQITKLKQQFIEQRQEYIEGRVSDLQKQLFDKVFNKLILELESSGGNIVSGDENIKLSTALDQIFKEFQSNQFTPVIKQFGEDLLKLTNYNKEYFTVAADKRIQEVDKSAQLAKKKMAEKLGVSESGKVKSKGYLDRLITDPTLKKQIKQTLLKGITNQKPVGEVTAQLQKIIVGNDKVNGGLVKHFNQYMRDTYTQFDALSSSIIATDLGIQTFIYQGGKIASSRCFCKEKDGKVFTVQEAEEWRDELGEECGPIWNEKTDGKYNPLTHRGGYECRHTLDYVSSALAIRLRPDLRGKI
jgi:hypothetical protein